MFNEGISSNAIGARDEGNFPTKRGHDCRYGWGIVCTKKGVEDMMFLLDKFTAANLEFKNNYTQGPEDWYYTRNESDGGVSSSAVSTPRRQHPVLESFGTCQTASDRRVFPVLHACPHWLPIREVATVRTRNSTSELSGSRRDPARYLNSTHDMVGAQESLTYMQKCYLLVSSRHYGKPEFTQVICHRSPD